MEKPFNEIVFLQLSSESQGKVECIYHIAVILKLAKVPPLTAKDFDHLYDKPLDELDSIVGQVRMNMQIMQGIEEE